MSAALSLKKRSNRPLETLSAITESFSKFAFVFWTTKTTTKYIKNVFTVGCGGLLDGDGRDEWW